MSGPISRQLGTDRTETHFLSHAEWNPMPHICGRGAYETGVRPILAGEVSRDKFFLIQHDWFDWKLAGEVIKNLLAKDRSPHRICEVMQFIKDRAIRIPRKAASP